MTIMPDRSAGRPRLGLYATHARLEVKQLRRSTESVLSIVAIPALLYSMFAMHNDAAMVPGGATFRTLAVGSFTAYGILTLALFLFAGDVARERGRGWMRTLRATPVPVSSYVVAKLVMGVTYAGLIFAAIMTLALISGADVSPGQWLALAGVLFGGLLALCTVGFAIAFLARPRGANAVVTLTFLPLSFASGFFIPLSELPGVFRDIAPGLPTYHLGQLVWRVLGTDADVAAMTDLPVQSIGVHIAWVTGTAAIGLVVAVTAAGREAVTRRT